MAYETPRQRIERLVGTPNVQSQENWLYHGFRATGAIALAILEVAEQMGRIADLMEGRDAQERSGIPADVPTGVPGEAEG